MNELTITKKELPVVEWNYQQLKEETQKLLKDYDGLIVTSQTLPDCQKDQKKLASLKKKLSSARIEAKKELSKPITQFEAEVKEIVSLIELVETPLKESLSVFEVKRKKDKKQEIINLLFSKGSDIETKYLDGVEIPSELLNKTTTQKSITSFVETIILDLQNEAKTRLDNEQLLKDEIIRLNKDISSEMKFEQFSFDFNDLSGSLINIRSRFDIIKESEEATKKALETKLAEEARIVAEKKVREEQAEKERLAKIEAEKVRAEELKEQKRLEAIEKAKQPEVVEKVEPVKQEPVVDEIIEISENEVISENDDYTPVELYKDKGLTVSVTKTKWIKLIDFLIENSIEYKLGE